MGGALADEGEGPPVTPLCCWAAAMLRLKLLTRSSKGTCDERVVKVVEVVEVVAAALIHF